MKILIKDVVAAILILTVIFAVVATFIYGFDKSEEVKCLQLLTQSEEYPFFHLSVFEKEMCDYQGIIIDAPVK